ncbi:hypothetical protein Q0Z83_050060 [Actinoplanes sichuanensis]|uniref:Uncharacterized protein n=1 Tax=Actinoplanes sichuanensis TaxID=512349 RepID=A0ABW4AN34_9ACTN|nr:hypothetical protein [Actinoplanes sichuanensis]BEL06815.1 hypothetical protein Q0Z83_050060 [Actinoplanes sichuanensis]
MIEAGRRELRRMRESAEAWPELRDEVRRAQVLWALQYDRRPEDLALVRWLAAEEARCRREGGFQGLTEGVELAGFLLAEYRQVEDVWTQWELKRADFDTWCGYDVEHLVAAGVQATIDFVRGSVHPYQQEVLERLLDDDGEPELSEEDVAEWAEQRRLWFPADPADEDPLTWAERARLVGDKALAREWLDRWSAGRPRDRDTLSRLRYQLADLDAFAEAAAAQRELVTFADSDWDRASAWQDLAGLERRAGDLGAAWAALRESGRAIDDVPGWTEVGLGRMFVHQLFLLAAAAGDDLAGPVFAEADRRAAVVPRLPVVVLRDAVTAALRVGDRGRVAHYERLRDAEQDRIDTELKR